MDESKTLGEDQELRTSTLVRHRPIQGESHINDFLENQKGLFHHLKTRYQMLVKQLVIFGPCYGKLSHIASLDEPRVKLYSPREESFRNSLKYVDVSRTTNTIWMLCKSAASMIIGISMGQEIGLTLGWFSLDLFCYKRNLPTNTCGPE